MTVAGVVRQALLDALALVMPIDCAGCGRPDRSLCDECRALMAPRLVRGALADGTPLVAGLAYRDPVRGAILAFKDHSRAGIAGVLAEALCAAIVVARDGVPAGDLEVCAVPSTRSARRRRGAEPVHTLLAYAGLRDARVFAPAREHRAQKSLSVADRRANLEGAFRLRRAVEGRRFLLIDDVVTTGATLLEAVRVLREGGAEVVAAVAVAATPKLGRDSS